MENWTVVLCDSVHVQLISAALGHHGAVKAFHLYQV